MDRISKAHRSWNMSRIKSSGTKPEMLLREALTENGVRYRCNVKSLPGRPDIANKTYRIALDVRGCFWHGHKNCKRSGIPKSNTQFWITKIERNIERDEKNEAKLKAFGFDYFVIWECELRMDSTPSTIQKVVRLYWHRRNLLNNLR